MCCCLWPTWQAIVPVDYKISSCLIMARESECLLEHPAEINVKCMDVSALTRGNQGELVATGKMVSISYTTTVETRDCQDPTKFSMLCTVVLNNHYELSFLPALSYPALAKVEGHAATSPAHNSACEVTV